MLTTEQTEAVLNQKMDIPDGLHEERTEGLTANKGSKNHVLQWFVETQHIIQSDGHFPPWFQGLVTRQEAEDQLRDKSIGCFLIRLSEKAIGYILSYKGVDRCRHFIINQTNTGLFAVSGDCTTHNSLMELIDHFKSTPIQPFGEYLISSDPERDFTEKEPGDELYDVVQPNARSNSGVSVKALRSLWEQTSLVTQHIPVPRSKSNRKLTTSTSIDRDSLSEERKNPPPLKKNAPLRNSLSVDLPCTQPFDAQQDPAESKPSLSSEAGESETPDKECQSHELKSPPQQENQQSSLYSHNLTPLIPQQTAYSVLERQFLQIGAGEIPLQPNPLYQSSPAPCHGMENDKVVEVEYDDPTSCILLSENLYQDVHEQFGGDTYNPESNTYDDIPMTENNMYASLDEMQTPSQNNPGKKNHKWWKFRQENKK